MVDILFTYDNPVPGSYGDVYLRAAKLLEKEGVTSVCLDLEGFLQEYDFSDGYLQGVVDSLSPKLVLSHRHSLGLSMQGKGMDLALAEVLKEEIETFFTRHYWGRIQTDSHYCSENSVEFKEGFIRRMREAGLPHPETLLRDEVPTQNWNYPFLNCYLNGPSEREGFYLKDVCLQRGKGVFYVKNEKEFLTGSKIRIAQQKVTPEGIPCSVRVVTFPGEIIGAFFCYNVEDDWKSNTSSGYHKFVLSSSFGKMNGLERHLLKKSGLKPSLGENEELVRLALKVSSLPSQSLLRGIDFVFDEEGKPYLIEAQTGSGNPWEGSYSLLQGRMPGTEVENIGVAAEVIAGCLYRYLNRK